MRSRRFQWTGAEGTAAAIRAWADAAAPPVDVGAIEQQVREDGDAALLRLTARFDATEAPPSSIRLEADAGAHALATLETGIRESLELAIANVRAVAAAQVDEAQRQVELPQGHVVSVGEVAVRAAGIYAPGGRAPYPSSVVMGAVPARAAGVGRLALATPPRADGTIDPLVLAAAELSGVDEIYAVGGAQAIFALAYGTESIAAVDVVVGPGNAWVREAKRSVAGLVGIDSLAGPSELMLVAGPDTDPEWAALDLCAQAEHGADGPLLAAAADAAVLDEIAAAAERAAASRPGVGDSTVALVQVPGTAEAIELANAFAPEHLELLDEASASLADRVSTAGCIFAGPLAATAFGDYVAGSNHVLPTGGAGRFSGPLGPHVFRRKIATVEVSAGAAAKLAPHVKALAEAEGFPVHGESAMIRR